MKVLYIKTILLLFIISFSCLKSQLLADTLSSCTTIIDSLKKSVNISETGYSYNFQRVHDPVREKFLLFGAGLGYINSFETEYLNYVFFGGRFWQLNDIFSIGGYSELATEFNDSFLFDAAFTTLYYPFLSSIIPFGAISTGPGFFRYYGENSAIISSSFELGFIVEPFSFALLISTRLNVLIDFSLPFPLVYTLRVGAAF